MYSDIDILWIYTVLYVHWLNKGNCIYIVYYTFCTPLFYTNFFFLNWMFNPDTSGTAKSKNQKKNKQKKMNNTENAVSGTLFNYYSLRWLMACYVSISPALTICLQYIAYLLKQFLGFKTSHSLNLLSNSFLSHLSGTMYIRLNSCWIIN